MPNPDAVTAQTVSTSLTFHPRSTGKRVKNSAQNATHTPSLMNIAKTCEINAARYSSCAFRFSRTYAAMRPIKLNSFASISTSVRVDTFDSNTVNNRRETSKDHDGDPLAQQ